MVRGPMMADDTAGWVTAKDIAMWVRGRPASAASGIKSIYRIELAVIAEVLRHRIGTVCSALEPLAVPPRKQPLRQGAPDQRAHAVSQCDRQDVAFDAPIEDRVRRLLGAKWLESAALGGPV